MLPPSSRVLFKAPTAAQAASTEFDRFRRFANSKYPSLNLLDYWTTHAWSIRESNAFWVCIWEFMNIIGTKEDIVSGQLCSQDGEGVGIDARFSASISSSTIRCPWIKSILA